MADAKEIAQAFQVPQEIRDVLEETVTDGRREGKTEVERLYAYLTECRQKVEAAMMEEKRAFSLWWRADQAAKKARKEQPNGR